MFGVALQITTTDFKQLIHNPKPVLVGVASQFLLLPGLTFLLVLLLKPYPSIALGMFMVAACPGGNISNFISQMAGGNSALSVSLTAIATLLAIVMTPFNLHFWGSMYSPTNSLLQTVSINFIDMFQVVALILGVPLVLGMWVRHKYPLWAKKMGQILKKVSILFFLLLVGIALGNNSDIFADYVMVVFWLVLAHNITAFLGGFTLASIFGLSLADKKSITIETGIQNSGLGLLLIFTFFDGLGGMALLAAFWGIWHILSGLLLASLWSSKKTKSTQS
jgi:BASS family bile acid:Na+ symporter